MQGRRRLTKTCFLDLASETKLINNCGSWRLQWRKICFWPWSSGRLYTLKSMGKLYIKLGGGKRGKGANMEKSKILVLLTHVWASEWKSQRRSIRNHNTWRPNCGVVAGQAERLVCYSVNSGKMLMILENNVSWSKHAYLVILHPRICKLVCKVW